VKILLAEDDRNLGIVIKNELEDEHYLSEMGECAYKEESLTFP